jgi:hypothetical protein
VATGIGTVDLNLSNMNPAHPGFLEQFLCFSRIYAYSSKRSLSCRLQNKNSLRISLLTSAG